MSSKMGISLTGDWRRLASFLRQPQEVIDTMNDEIRAQAQELADSVKDEIPFYQTPNADKTIQRKGHDRPLEEDGGLRDEGIIVDELQAEGDTGRYKKYFVVKGDPNSLVETGDRDHDGLTYEKLLEIMELGADGAGISGNVVIPPRPILSITFNRMEGHISRKLIMKFEHEVHAKLRRG